MAQNKIQFGDENRHLDHYKKPVIMYPLPKTLGTSSYLKDFTRRAAQSVQTQRPKTIEGNAKDIRFKD